VALAAFSCVFGGALVGIRLRAALPSHHLNPDSRDVMKLGMGLVGTMAALALGLLLAAAKSSYDAQGEELRQIAATALLLDRALAHYGPEAADARRLLREAIAHALGRIWAGGGWQPPDPTFARKRDFFDAIEQLEPRDSAQHLLQTQLLRIGLDLGRLRLMLIEEAARPMPTPFLVMLIFWLTIIFVSFGLFAPANYTVVTTLLVCALSVSGAIYLILELAHPFTGLLKIADVPLRHALQNLGR
jgi:hypothetical protein